MGEYRKQYYEKQDKKRKRRVRMIKAFMIGSVILILLLVMYIVYAMFMLISETVEYGGARKNEGSVVYELSTEERTEKEDAVANGFGNEDDSIREKLEYYARQNNFDVSEYTEELIELVEKNPETEEFVLNYPMKKGISFNEPLNECLNQEEVPLLMQWDSRWGYCSYGDGVIGMTGCGPTCLSMVAIHLLQNPEFTPIYLANYAMQKGYYVQGAGTDWQFMTDGASSIGLKVQEVPLDENVVIRHLEQGTPIICAMGPGDFTENGHFIVFTGIEDGKIKVNDPNSKHRSEKLWSFEDIKYQIRNMWAYSL